MSKLKVLFGIICVIAVNNIQTAHAQTVYATRSDFNVDFPSANVENWTEYPFATVITNGETLGPITYTTIGYNSIRVTPNLDPHFKDGIGNNNIFDLFAFTSKDETTFTFASPLTAFGVDIDSTALRSGSFEAIFSDNGNVVETVDSNFDPIPGDPLEQFIGLSDPTDFNSVTIEDLTKNPYKIDTLEYVYDASATGGTSAVPEPSTIALMLAGLIGIAVLAVRRRLTLVK